MKIKPINPKLKPLLEEFLAKPELQETFASHAKRLGYVGSDAEKIKVSLFTPSEDGEICFADVTVENLFVDFQIRKILRDFGIPDDLEPDIMNQLIEECRATLADIRNNPEQE